MKTSLLAILFVSALTLAVNTARAEDAKLTLTGEGKCTKCAMKETDSCQNAITIEEKGKKVTYYIEHNDVSKKFHGEVCKGPKNIKAVGALKEVDGKKVFVATELTATK
ncbi:MAG: hypothetical protein EXS30_09930 [Pedosphaera sp.]|nr:hypothetical protein [Pedosphaera sp.]